MMLTYQYSGCNITFIYLFIVKFQMFELGIFPNIEGCYLAAFKAKYFFYPE